MPLKTPQQVADALNSVDIGNASVNKLFNELADAYKEEFKLIYIKAILETFNEIVRNTPYLTGLARGNWQIDNKSDDYELTTEVETPEELFPEQRLLELNLDDIIWIYNNLPYIEQLEAGYSQQPNGQHFVANALNNLAVRLRIIAKELQGFE